MDWQDRQGARTASDLERKYYFGKSFEEITGIATDARGIAEEAQKTVSGLDQTQIFNILTNNGKAKGIYVSEGDIYINASYIGSGQIASSNYLADCFTLVRYSYTELEATTYYFKWGYQGNYHQFTTTKTVPFGGSIVFYENFFNIQTFDDSGNIIETLKSTSTNIPGGEPLPLDVSAFFSETGTKIDLENGEIISTQFAVTRDGAAYFGGKLETNSGRLGAFKLSMRGLAAISSNGCGVTLADSWLYFKSDTLGTGDGNVTFSAGDFLPSPIGDPHVVEIKNSNGDSMKVTPTSANLTGTWKATPYTGGEDSEVVTKQDLINLGLIQ